MQAGTDLELVEASRRGDRDAFAQIIERYHRAVYAVAFSGSCDRSLADDLTQDTFVTAWRRLDELRDGQRLPAWLCGIARNLARDARKRRYRETTGELDDLVDAHTPYEALSEAESERVVAAALGQVPDLYREPLVLYYYEERSIEDVARSLGISGATTNKRISRGRRFLAERVATIVERGLVRRGPSAAVAASVLALIGISLPASHVDASPLAKEGSTVHKLAIAATVLVSATASGLLLAGDSRPSDAHASASAGPAIDPHTPPVPAQSSSGTTATAKGATRLHDAPALFGKLAAAPAPSTIIASAANDCAAVGRHLQELEADTTHGPDKRPDDEACDKCTAHYKAMCEAEGWSLERRVCTLAAPDLINAHLCAAGTIAPANPVEIPAHLACSVLAPSLASKAQSAGFYADVADFAQQIESACEVGKWPVSLRQCFATGQTMDALAACMQDIAAASN